MATKDRRKLQHIHSSIADKQPTPQSLEVGEIAVNNSASKEFLSLKNSDDKVVRFSSDSTLIDWIENKEVVPYKGYVRGEEGPSVTSGDTPISTDDYGSYGITNNDLLKNKSNIIVKINQVAAKNTAKYNKINAAKDLYGNDINPIEETPTGKTDGAGFFIDMSRYAMMDANPSFSSVTVSAQTNLSGNTIISNGASGNTYGTDTGHTLTIKTTDVTANDTNWTETITNKKSTVDTEEDKIGTLNESATTRTTVIGTENLTVSGATTENKTGNVIENNFSDKTESTAGATNITRTGVVTEDNKNNVTRTTSGSTTETFKGQVTENNQSGYTVNTTGNVIVNTTGTTTETKVGNVVENHSGTTIENKKGDVTENNLANKTENTTSSHSIYSTGNTCINSQANANFYGKVNTNIGVACDGTTKGSATTVVGTTTLNMSGATTTISGNTTNVTGATTLNLIGGSITESSTNSVCITGGTTAAFVGATKTNIGKNCSDNGQTTTLNINGNTINETGTTVNVSGSTSANISGATVNVSGGSINETSAGKTCITAGGDLNIGGDANTNVGYNCAGTGIANNTNVFASTAVTINAPKTNITGDTYLSGKTYFHKTCTGLTNNEIDAAFCEILNRGAITIEKNINPSDQRLATIYTVKQNGTVINTIEVAKDKALKSASVVQDASGEWVIRLVWRTYDPDSGTETDTTTDVPASELVKDLTAVNPSDNGTALNHNVSVNAWYDATSGDMKFSAETTPNMHVGNMYVTGTTSASTVSGTNVNGGTISGTTVKGVTMSGTNITASDAIRANNVSANTLSAATSIRANNVSANTISAASSINTSDLYASSTVSGATVSGTTVKGATVSAGTLTATGNTTLAATTASSVSATSVSSPTINGTNITASAAMRANNVSANTISANTFTGAMSKKLTWTAGAFTADTTGYNGSADKTINVPTAISHLATRGKLTVTHNGLTDTYDPASDKSMTLPHSALTINFGVATGQTNTSYNTSAERTITIPTSTAHLSKATLTIDYNADVRSKSDTSYNTEAAATVSIPGSLDHLSNYDGTSININHPTKINGNVSVTGTITASGAIYSSDRNLKENIFDISENEFERVGFVKYKTYNFKGEDNKMYGVIAQDLQDAGLGEMVYSRDDGTLAVDYTSLMILQLARLKRDNENMLNHIAWLERRIEKLEGGNKE